MFSRRRRGLELQPYAKGEQSLERNGAEGIIPQRMRQKQRDRDHAGPRLTSGNLDIAGKSTARGHKEPAEKSQQEGQGRQSSLEQRFQKIVVGAIDQLRNESRRTFVERIYARKRSYAAAEGSKRQNRTPSLRGDGPTCVFSDVLRREAGKDRHQTQAPHQGNQRQGQESDKPQGPTTPPSRDLGAQDEWDGRQNRNGAEYDCRARTGQR